MVLALFIGRNRIFLVKGDWLKWCRRVIVAKEFIVEPKCQLDVPVWITEMKEPQDEVQSDRVVIGEGLNMTRVKAINLDDSPVIELSPGKLYPVEIERVVEFEHCLVRDNEMSLEDSSEEVALEAGTYLHNSESDEMHLVTLNVENQWV